MSAASRSPRALRRLLQRLVYRHWHSVHAIRRLEVTALERGLDLAAGVRILDLGCGKGPYVGALERRGYTAMGIDPDPAQLAVARRHVTRSGRLAAASGERLPFRDAAFDRVVSVCVLEHTDDDRRVLAEVRRVLKPGGVFALSVDSVEGFDEEFRASHARRFRCNRLYTRDDIRRKLVEAGFEVGHVRALFSGGIARAVVRFGERFRFRGPFVLLFPLLYPLLLADRLLSRGAADGLILAVKARPMRPEPGPSAT
jgi:SAM-dependent methyltransferase